MKINKIIYLILAIAFILVFSFFNFSEYNTFHQNKLNLEKKNITIDSQLKNFSLSDIKKIEKIDFFYTPNKDLLNKIVEKINNANNYIYLEVYMLTETRIQEALVKAQKRWIDIKVILEKDPYLAYNINKNSFEKLEKAWVNIMRSIKDNYAYNHSKVFIIDDLSIISTWNYSYSTFTQNRDLFIFTYDENIQSKLLENFNNDFNWIKVNIYDDNLIFSPNSSRIKFKKMFKSAEKSIDMYFQYIEDNSLANEILEVKKEKGIEINVIIAETASEDENISKFKKAWINIYIMSENKMHSKAILIDKKYLFIWSINFSRYSIDKNREVWILIKNENIVSDFINLLEQDIKKIISQ